MFTGQFNCVIDDKNRLAIPSAIRKRIDNNDTASQLYLTIGIGQCISLYPEEEFRKLASKIEALSSTDKNALKFQRIFFSKVDTLDRWDKQGRIIISQKHKIHAKLEREVVVIGLVNRVEIWDKKVWDDFDNENAGKFEEIAASVAI